MSSVQLPGALILSLDFELHWGVRSRVRPGDAYWRNLLGARAAVPRLLNAFAASGLAATWATVGMLFCRDRRERARFDPQVRPTYHDASLDPYREAVGDDEQADPLHYAPSLIELIARHPRQEVATHTYSHFFCTAKGQTREQFQSDLRAALAVARARGHAIRSIVFPRNQHTVAYDDVLTSAGLSAFRGVPPHWAYRYGTSAPLPARAVMYADSHSGLVAAPQPWHHVLEPSGLANLHGTMFLRPWHSLRSRLVMAAVERLMVKAARRGEIVHLWWHPHNHGVNTEANLRMVERIGEIYGRLHGEYGMLSLNMAEAADLVRRRSVPAH